jgi:hypothetical protein
MYLAFEAKERACKCKSTAPLSSTRFSCETLYPFLSIVPGLGDGRVGLMGACRTNTFILVVNPRWRIQQLLQPPSSVLTTILLCI